MKMKFAGDMPDPLENYEYHIGDRVRIRAKEDIPEYCYHGWNDLMNQWSGQEFEISALEGSPFNSKDVLFYAMPRDMMIWKWSTDMIEPITNPIQESELMSLLGI